MQVIDIIIQDKEKVNLADVMLEPESQQAILQLLKEFRYVEELAKYKLPVNNKILLHGPSGCGKTITAKAIANALNKPVYILNLGNVVAARIGETSQNLKQVFDKANRDGAVLFLDEFDQIGKMRSTNEQDVGEMRRLVNTLIQLIDYFSSKSLLIAATNHLMIIDTALMRRFQVIVKYEMPSRKVLDEYYDRLLSAFPSHLQEVERKYDISFAEARDHAYTFVKLLVIAEAEKGLPLNAQ